MDVTGVNKLQIHASHCVPVGAVWQLLSLLGGSSRDNSSPMPSTLPRMVKYVGCCDTVSTMCVEEEEEADPSDALVAATCVVDADVGGSADTVGGDDEMICRD